MVTVLVGPEEDEFEVHRVRLTQRSSYFRKILSQKPSDEAPVILKVPEISTPYFVMYWHWVYTSKLDDEALDYEDGTPRFVEHHRQPQRKDDETMRAYTRCEVLRDSSILASHLIRFWICADFLGDAECQDTISDELAKWFLDKHIPTAISASTIAFVDEKTRPGSPIRRFCIDWADNKLVAGSKIACLRGWFDPTAPKWLLLGALSFKLRREEGDWERGEDPRKASKEGRYHVDLWD
jgi:hypothetical protein